MKVTPFGFDRIFHEPETAPTIDVVALSSRADSLADEIERLKREHAAELEQLRIQAHEAGRAEAAAELDAALLAAVDALHGALEDMDARIDRAAVDMRKDAAEAVLAAAEMMAGHAIEQYPLRAIDEALERVLDQVRRGTDLVIRTNPVLAPALEQRLEARLGRERRRLAFAVVPDGDIPVGDARVSWDQGGLAVDAAARRAAVIEELAPLFESAATRAA